MKKLSILFAALLVCGMSWGADPQVTLSITQNQNVSSLLYNFTATSDASLSASEGAYLKAGSGSKSVKHITLQTDFFNSKLIKKVEVWATSKANSGVTPKVLIGDELIGEGSEYTTQNASSGGTKFEVTNSDEKTGALKVEISRTSASKNAIYFNKLIVTYTEGDDQVVNSLEITEASISVEEGKSSAKLTVVVDPTDTKVFWGSKNESVATVVDGVVTGVAAGTTKVYAKAGDKSDTCEVTVTENASAIWYELVTDQTELNDGDKIMISKKGAEILMSKNVNYNGDKTTANFSPVTTGVVCKDEYAKCRELESVVYTLVKNGDNWNIQAADNQYLTIDAARKAHLTSSPSQISISCSSTGTATIQKANATGNGTLQYNSSAKMFTTYTSAQSSISLYYFHDPNAGKITVEPKKAELPTKRLEDEEAFSELDLVVTGENLENAIGILAKIEQDTVLEWAYPNPDDDATWYQYKVPHAGIFEIDKTELDADGGTIKVSYDVTGLVIQAEDTTINAKLTLEGLDLNGDVKTLVVPVSVILQREPVKLVPITIEEMTGLGMANVGGVAGSTKATSSDVYLLNNTVLVYKNSSVHEYIVKDETGYLMVESTTDAALGDTICGLRGHFKTYEKRFSFVLDEASVTSIAGEGALSPELYTDMPEYRLDMSRYIRYEGVEFSNSTTIDINGNDLKMVTKYLTPATPIAGAPYNIEGIVAFNGNNITQLLVTKNPEIDPNYQRPATGVNISKSELTLNVGEQEQLSATVLPTGENPQGAFNKNVVWSVDDASIVMVDNEGHVRAMKEGTAVVTVTTEDGGFTKSCTITVTDIVTLKYGKVTAINDLAEGDKVILVAPAFNKAAGEFGSKNYSGADVTIENDTILVKNDASVAIFTLGKDGDYWTLTTADGKKLGKSTDTDKKLVLDDGEITWRIVVTDECDSIISTDDTYPTRFLVYNSNSSGGNVFNAYSYYGSNNMNPVKLFREAGKKLEEIEPTEVVVNPQQKEVVVGSQLQLEALVLPEVSQYRDVVWESMNTGLASVDEAGLVSAIGVGEVKIVAKSERNTDITDTCFLTIRDSVHVESVIIKIAGFQRTKYTIKQNETVQLVAEITPDNADVQHVEWRSSDESVATVSADGLVSALEPGTAIITADTKDRGVKAELTLTVNGTPQIHVDKESIVFEPVIYKGVTLTHRDSIEVVGQYLSGEIYVSLSGEGFSVSAAKLPAEGGKLYVDYAIAAGGDFEGSISLSGEGAIPVTVSLSLHADEEVTIAQLLEREPEKGNKTGTKDYLLNDVVVTYQNGDKLYVRDATGSLLINNADDEFENGTILKGMVGHLNYVKYSPELELVTQPTSEAGSPVEADTLLTYPVRKDIGNYVIIPAVKFNKDATLDANNKSAEIMLDNGRLTVYNTYSMDFGAVDTKHLYNILGTIMKYGENVFEVSPIAISISDEPYMYAEFTFAFFDNNEIDASGKAIGSEVITLDTMHIKELQIEGTSIFGGTFEDGKLTVDYVATEAGRYEGTVTVTGIPTKEGAANAVIVIDCIVDIAAYSEPLIIVDKDEIVFDSITVKYMEHQKGSAVVNVTTQFVKNLTVSNSNKDVFDAVLSGNQLTISYDVYKGGEFKTVITLKGEAEVAGKTVNNVTIYARISVGQYPDEEGVENVNAEQFRGIRFNILGQRVDDNYRGIVIENGQKKVIK